MNEPLRDRQQCREFTSGFGELRKYKEGAASDERVENDPSLHLAANFAVMHKRGESL